MEVVIRINHPSFLKFVLTGIKVQILSSILYVIETWPTVMEDDGILKVFERNILNLIYIYRPNEIIY